MDEHDVKAREAIDAWKRAGRGREVRMGHSPSGAHAHAWDGSQRVGWGIGPTDGQALQALARQLGGWTIVPSAPPADEFDQEAARLLQACEDARDAAERAYVQRGRANVYAAARVTNRTAIATALRSTAHARDAEVERLRAALAEMVAAITAPDAFPTEREETPFGDSVTLLENPRITAAITAARTALSRTA